ncbi:hypothetical protein [Jongsikchunia kroppenstedtii]|uniref:hypothetical protein n=1 Tax=Jongsikchunia kroppenstedtii TaxID=1121721 RepID=UPI0005BCAA1F|nr:hypothetical protein [Jongsikchunia kroppenstedtii]
MAKSFVAPYLVPDSDAIEMQPWTLDMRGESTPLGAVVDNWVSGTDLNVSRGVTMNLDSVRQRCGLPEQSELGLVVTWMSDSSKIRRRVLTKQVLEPRNEVSVTLPGNEIGGTIRLSTSLILLADIDRPAPGTPHRRGSILYTDVISVVLEGEGSMFPMAVVDFDARPYDSRASWHVETSTDLDADFSSTFQVLVNEKDKPLIKAIESEKPNREQQALLDELSSGVMQVVLELAYAMKSLGDLAGGDFETGTVGDVLFSLIEQTGDVDLGDLSEPNQIGRRSSVFQGMARGLAAGRVF